MRILFLSEDFPNPRHATRGTFNAQMVRALARREHVVVIAPVPWREEGLAVLRGAAARPVRVADGVDVHHPLYFYPPGVLRTAYGWFLWRSVAGTFRKILETFSPDVVLSYWLHPQGAVAVRMARELGVPAVVMSGGSDLLLLTRRPLRRTCIAGVLRQAEGVVCVSAHLARAAAAIAGTDISVHVVRRGVDRERFYASDRAAARSRLGWEPDSKALLWVGRMVAVKGIDVLVDAMGHLRRAGLDVVLHLVGDGPERGEVLRRAQRAGVADRVRLAGIVLHRDLPDWYRAADVTVLPSRSEGVPNVLLESIACGTPFVASDVGGVSEIADAREDRLVPADDAPALASAIAEVLRSEPGDSRRFVPGSWADSADSLSAVLKDTILARHQKTGATRRWTNDEPY